MSQPIECSSRCRASWTELGMFSDEQNSSSCDQMIDLVRKTLGQNPQKNQTSGVLTYLLLGRARELKICLCDSSGVVRVYNNVFASLENYQRALELANYYSANQLDLQKLDEQLNHLGFEVYRR